MLRRFLVIGALGVSTALGVRLALGALAERAWEARRAELAALALPPESLRRPWEVRYEALEAIRTTSDRFREIQDSPHRPAVAWGGAAPRPLDAFEELWVAAAEQELAGLATILRELRALPLEELAWHGDAVQLGFLREVVGFLCARAWLAAGRGEHAAAARDYADALRLAEATDDRSQLGTIVRYACQVNVVLVSARAALALGLPAHELRTALAPLLARWAYDPARAEHGIRVEVTAFLDEVQDSVPDDPADALRQFADLEQALALARGPLADAPWVLPEGARPGEVTPLARWTHGVRQLHAFHAARNVALTALAVAAHREAHGAWPATLGELADLPADQALDPLTGTALPYALVPAGARIGPAAWAERAEPGTDLEESPFVWNLR